MSLSLNATFICVVVLDLTFFFLHCHVMGLNEGGGLMKDGHQQTLLGVWSIILGCKCEGILNRKGLALLESLTRGWGG